MQNYNEPLILPLKFRFDNYPFKKIERLWNIIRMIIIYYYHRLFFYYCLCQNCDDYRDYKAGFLIHMHNVCYYDCQCYWCTDYKEYLLGVRSLQRMNTL